MKKYGKKILAQRELTIDNDIVTCLILEDESKDYWNIHIIMHPFNDDELNTLDLQEPKLDVKFEDITTIEYMYSRIFEKYIWHKLYGIDGKSLFTASVTIENNGEI